MAVGPGAGSGSKALSSRSSPWPIAALLAMVAYAHGQPVSSADIRVIDGDTIALSGLREHVRLVGFNAPETPNARCEAKAQLGQRAKQRLQVSE